VNHHPGTSAVRMTNSTTVETINALAEAVHDTFPTNE
jgi:hypothetical protein